MEQQTGLEIEQLLSDDVTGQYKRQLTEQFAVVAQQIRMQLNRGLSPAEYQRFNKLLKAVEAATTVVEALWPELRNAPANRAIGA